MNLNFVFKQIKQKRAYFKYTRYYENAKIRNNTILLESAHGREINGHIFYILKELVQNHQDFKVYIVTKNRKHDEFFLRNNGIINCELVDHLSMKYYKLLSSVEILINDTTFYPFYTKKENQKYYMIWHGTPLKKMGRDTKEILVVANVQRNFYMADKIYFSNEYTKNIMLTAYNLENVYSGEIIVGPSPRNSILFSGKERIAIRKENDLKDKKVYLYMPTWRGQVSEIGKENTLDTLTIIEKISENLADDTIMYIKLHPYEKDLEISKFENIRTVPDDYEIYTFLTAVDTLITDYSSVIYDFIDTGRDIILYTPDYKEYTEERGLYEDINELPLTNIDNIEDLITLLRQEKNERTYDDEFAMAINPYDNVQGTSEIVDNMISGKENENIKTYSTYNGKENVFLLSGGFWDNGITTALTNMLESIDTSERNYITYFEKQTVSEKHYSKIEELVNSGVGYYPIVGNLNVTLTEALMVYLYLRTPYKFKFYEKRYRRIFEREIRRTLGFVENKVFVHYTGFEQKYAWMMKYMRDTKKFMFVHTDMFAEYEAKANFNRKIIFENYNRVDKLVLVNEKLKDKIISRLSISEEKINILNNFLGEERIRRLADENLVETLKNTEIQYSELDISTTQSEIEKFVYEMTESLGIEKQRELDKGLTDEKKKIIATLLDPKKKVLINIGRASYQKGMDRLIKGFEANAKEDPETYLLIISPHGELMEELLAKAQNSKFSSRIIILGGMNNPYAVLKSSDYFIFSSYYEGLGLVLYEALALGLKSLTTNIPETIELLDGDEVLIVDNTQEGINDGIKILLEDNLVFRPFDFEKQKIRSINEFEDIFGD